MKYFCVTLIFLVCLSCQHPANKKEKERNKTYYIPESYKEDSRINSIYSEDSRNAYSHDREFDYATSDYSSNAVLEMEVENGVRYVWIEINDIRLRFIFDTGASNICISPAEAAVLFRQGTLKEEDFMGYQYFQDATGRISEGTKINLRTVTLGNVVLHNVEATIIDNLDAPLLLGQSALEHFRSIEIDNLNNLIIFK